MKTGEYHCKSDKIATTFPLQKILTFLYNNSFLFVKSFVVKNLAERMLKKGKIMSRKKKLEGDRVGRINIIFMA